MSRLVWTVLLLSAVGCGGSPPPTAASPPAPTEDPPPVSTASPRAANGPTWARSSVHSVVTQGLGTFLQRLDLDDKPVLVGGRFHGFRIAALHDAAFWNGVDLRPGDVVTSVNGFPIERPEQAQTAFDSLDVASEVRIAYERDGNPRELVYTIADGK